MAGVFRTVSSLLFKNIVTGVSRRSTPLVCNASVKLMSTGQYEYIKVEKVGSKQNVGFIQLDRPKALNALCSPLMAELNAALVDFDNDESIGCIVLTGSDRAFAAGADINEMLPKSFIGVYNEDFLSKWIGLEKVRIPIIAAVNGYALGGGCEVAMTCDIIYAGEKAVFGQPEITLGTIPGAGGTQRLAKAIGKSKAMEMILSANNIGAAEAEKSGLVSKVFPVDQLVAEAIKTAEKIASHSRIVTVMCKEAAMASFELSLQEGLHFERRIFHQTFSTSDRKEGMAAFVEKRPAEFKNE